MYYRNRDKIKFTLIVVGVLLGMFLIWNGFNIEQHKITQCKAITSKWVLAEYSDTSIGVDMNGNMTTDTDYWDEPASEVFTIYTVNGDVRQTDIPYDVKYGGVAIPSIFPSRNESMSKNSDFDNFSYQISNKYYVFFEDSDYATHGLNIHPTCMERMKLEKLVTVNVWYGMKRSIEMDL